MRRPKSAAAADAASKREDHRLRIVEDARKGTLVQGLEEVLVRDASEVCVGALGRGGVCVVCVCVHVCMCVCLCACVCVCMDVFVPWAPTLG